MVINQYSKALGIVLRDPGSSTKKTQSIKGK
jgi:hypothetical protein